MNPRRAAPGTEKENTMTAHTGPDDGAKLPPEADEPRDGIRIVLDVDYSAD